MSGTRGRVDLPTRIYRVRSGRLGGLLGRVGEAVPGQRLRGAVVLAGDRIAAGGRWPVTVLPLQVYVPAST